MGRGEGGGERKGVQDEDGEEEGTKTRKSDRRGAWAGTGAEGFGLIMISLIHPCISFV